MMINKIFNKAISCGLPKGLKPCFYYLCDCCN